MRSQKLKIKSAKHSRGNNGDRTIRNNNNIANNAILNTEIININNSEERKENNREIYRTRLQQNRRDLEQN